MSNFYERLQKISKDTSLSREQRISIINREIENYQKNAEKEYREELLRQFGGAALEIGSAAVPASGVGKLGAKLGEQYLKKQLGRKISQNIGSSVVEGGLAGGLFSLGQSITEHQNPLLNSIEGAAGGMFTGAALGGVLGKGEQLYFGQQLKNYGNIDDLGEELRKKYNIDAKQYYKDYLQERQINKNGPVDFSRRGVQEQLRWNPQQAQNFPELVNDIKNAQRLPNEPNLKPLEKPDVSHYEVYRGKNGDHFIEVSKSGKKRYYITKDAPIGSDHTTNMGTNKSIGTYLESPNEIMTDFSSKYNPSEQNIILSGSISYDEQRKNILDNLLERIRGNTTGQAISIQPDYDNVNKYLQDKIFTNESIGKMTPDEFIQNESKIFEQISDGRFNSQQNAKNFSGFKNPFSGEDRIFSREEIGAMNGEEFSSNEKSIMAQLNSYIGIPTSVELNNSAQLGTGAVYVAPYTRADGTKVKGYYRSR